MMNIAMAQTMIGMVEAAGSVGRGSHDAEKGGAAPFSVRAALRRVLGGWRMMRGRMARPVMGSATDVGLTVKAIAGTSILDRARAV